MGGFYRLPPPWGRAAPARAATRRYPRGRALDRAHLPLAAARELGIGTAVPGRF